MRGGRMPEHFLMRVESREAEALVKLFGEIQGDKDFPLNEYEEQLVAELVEILSDTTN